MFTLIRFISGRNTSHRLEDILLLILRIAVGSAMLTHGITKILNFGEMASGFMDPLGVGSEISFLFVLFVELIGAIGLILGVVTRVCAAILMFNMLITTYLIGMVQGWAGIELACLYSMVYLTLLILGGGRIALEQRWLTKQQAMKTAKQQPSVKQAAV
jgi:putative oxidoreductase